MKERKKEWMDGWMDERKKERRMDGWMKEKERKKG